MKSIYMSALESIQRRIDNCKKRANKNDMQDCGWTDRQHHAYSMQEMYRAIYKYEQVNRRFKKAV
jgi:uncharacterized protein YecT (DUF1311 family)